MRALAEQLGWGSRHNLAEVSSEVKSGIQSAQFSELTYKHCCPV